MSGSRPRLAVLRGAVDGSARFVVALPAGVDAGAVVAELAEHVGGGGGGPGDFAQGGGPDVEALDAALEAVPELLQQLLDA